MSRFIIVTDSASTTATARNMITEFLEARGWSVWHWFRDLWLVDEAPEDVNLGEIRNEIRNTVPGVGRFMVMTTDGTRDHAGWVQSDSRPWLKEHWHRK